MFVRLADVCRMPYAADDVHPSGGVDQYVGASPDARHAMPARHAPTFGERAYQATEHTASALGVTAVIIWSILVAGWTGFQVNKLSVFALETAMGSISPMATVEMSIQQVARSAAYRCCACQQSAACVKTPWGSAVNDRLDCWVIRVSSHPELGGIRCFG